MTQSQNTTEDVSRSRDESYRENLLDGPRATNKIDLTTDREILRYFNKAKFWLHYHTVTFSLYPGLESQQRRETRFTDNM